MNALRRTREYLSRPGLGPTLVRATLGSGGIRLLGMFFGFLVGVQLARGLGVEAYGVYGLAMSIVAVLAVPTQFGIPQLLTREVARAHASHDWPQLLGVVGWANRTVLLTAAGIAVALVAGALFWPGGGPAGLAITLLWGVLLIPLIALCNVRGATLRGLQQIVLGQLPDLLIRPALFSLFLLVATLVIPALESSTAMGLHAAAAGVALAMAALWVRRVLPAGVQARPPAGEQRRWLGSAFPFALTEGMRMLQGHMGTLFLGALATETAVGLFRVSLATAGVVAVPISLLNVVSAPIVARLHADQQHARLRRMAPAVAGAMLIGVAILAAPLFTAGGWFLQLAFGAEFEASLPALLILMVGELVNAAFGINATILNMTGHERYATRAFAVSLAINVVMSVVLIPRFGATGAAIASAIAILGWNLLMWLDVLRLTRLDSSILSVYQIYRKDTTNDA